MTNLRRLSGRRARALASTAGALACALALSACTPAAPPGEVIPGVRVGVTLPAAADRTLAPIDVEMPIVGGDGETISLGDLRGQVVVLNFWASWCEPCRREQADLNDARDVLADQPIVFLGVNIDDTEPNALAHMREFSMEYDSIFDPDVAYAAGFGAVGPRSIPTTIIIDAEGRVALRLFGITDTLEVSIAAERVAQEVGTAAP